MLSLTTAALCAVALAAEVGAFAPPPSLVAERSSTTALCDSRREFISSAVAVAIGSASGVISEPSRATAYDVDTEDFLKTGTVAMPMGVSGQAGKAKPVTGIVFREGSEASRDGRGNVLAEILVGKKSDPIPVLATFSSPWSLAKGGLFDVECRDATTGDGAFLTVSPSKGGQSVADLPKTFFTDSLFSTNGRFSFYGAPTDIKVRKSEVNGAYRYLEIVFSNLSQSTNAEIPRTALVAATIPEGTNDVVMLVGSATSNRWKRGAEGPVRETVGSFKATLAPTSGMKVRAKRDPNEL